MRKVLLYAFLVVGLIVGLVRYEARPAFAQPVTSCATDPTEPHPLRPYPGEICGPESTRTIDQTDKPYCAMRPWGAKDIFYLKNQEDCRNTPYSADFPCIFEQFRGTYEIDLRQYELPLVSINRDGSDLTSFNRAQEHIADYLEGRAYYEGLVEPEPDAKPEWYALWNRLGVFRKIAPLGEQDEQKKRNIQRAVARTIHNYIVGYRVGSNPAPWGTGTPVRMTQFAGNYPPAYTCSSITDFAQRETCIRQYRQRRTQWEQTIYGRLWPNVPMFTREDAKGFVQVNPEPDQWFDPSQRREVSMVVPVSLPHLPRLNAISTRLQAMLSSRVREAQTAEETTPYLGASCPAGPWWIGDNTAFYNACYRGTMCDLGQAYYSPGDYALDSTLRFQAKHEETNPPNPKIVPQPYYEEYNDFTCQANECLTGVSSTTYCASQIDDELPAIRECTAINLPYCDISDCQSNPSEPRYCDVGARRYCDGIYMAAGWYQCNSSGNWSFPSPPVTGDSGACRSEPLHPIRGCNDGTAGDPGSGTWINLPERPAEQGRCEEMRTPLKIAFTPGYVLTYTPYLRSIWENTVNQVQAIFTPFRTAVGKTIYDWPGESFIGYNYPDDYAEAGAPPATVPGSMTKIYFRYLGYIHCAKENLLNKLSPLLYDIPYVYYDARCNADLW